MRSCEPVAVEGDVVSSGFAHNFHRSKVEEEQNKRLVEEVLSHLMGQGCRVRCVLSAQRSPQGSAAAPSSRPPSEPTAREPTPVAREATPSAEQIMAEDPVVRAAVEDLGAQIVQRRD